MTFARYRVGLQGVSLVLSFRDIQMNIGSDLHGFGVAFRAPAIAPDRPSKLSEERLVSCPPLLELVLVFDVPLV